MSTVLIVAAHGYGNVGDDICAHSGAYLVSQVDPKLKTIITSPPYNPLVVRKADAVILSGGGIIYDRVEENVDNYLRYLEYGQKRGLPTAVIGVGVQGIVTDRGKARYKEVLNRAKAVSVRSQADKAILDEIGVKNVVASQDLGLLADEWVKKPLIKPRLEKSSRPRLGLALTDVRSLVAYKNGNPSMQQYIRIVESNLSRLSDEFDIWLFTHSKDDIKWSDELASKYNINKVPYKNIKDLPKLFYLYQQMDLVVGVRFHSIVLGILAKKPVVGISSAGSKVFRMAAESPTLHAQSYQLGNPSKINELFTNLRSSYEAGQFKPLPQPEVESLKNKVHQNLDLLKAILNP